MGVAESAGEDAADSREPSGQGDHGANGGAVVADDEHVGGQGGRPRGSRAGPR